MAIRPLCIGIRKGETRDEYIIASEDALFESQGFKKLRDVEPGEAVYIDKKGNFLFSTMLQMSPKKGHVFLNMYIFQDQILTLMKYLFIRLRMRMGSKLAELIKKKNPDHDIDVVIPIPDSSTTAALAASRGLKCSLQRRLC